MTARALEKIDHQIDEAERRLYEAEKQIALHQRAIYIIGAVATILFSALIAKVFGH